MRTICLFFFILSFYSIRIEAQEVAPPSNVVASPSNHELTSPDEKLTPPGKELLPSNEEFLNEVLLQMGLDPIHPYFLIAGTDSCWFEKFDYDEWIKYHLQESAPFMALNELAYKVHLAREPYYWQQSKLNKAICITAAKADSLLSPRPYDSLKTVFSISRPQFTDDGQYAVIDINSKECFRCGAGFTFIYRRDSKGWRRIGYKTNWSGIMY